MMKNGLCECVSGSKGRPESDTLATDSTVSQHARTTGVQSFCGWKKKALKHLKTISVSALKHLAKRRKSLHMFSLQPKNDWEDVHLKCVCVSRALLPLSQRLLGQTPAPLWPWSELNADIRMCLFQTAESANLHQKTRKILHAEDTLINESSAGRSIIKFAPCGFIQFCSSHSLGISYTHKDTHT